MTKRTAGPWHFRFMGGGWFLFGGGKGLPVVLAPSNRDFQVNVDGRLVAFDPKHPDPLAIAAVPDLIEALEAQEAFDKHAADCPDCQDATHCPVGIELSNTARWLRGQALAKVHGESP